MRNLVGQQIGPYKIEELLGAGGMADVYRAHQANLDRYVAVKVLKTSLADDPEFVTRFGREAMAAGGLRHNNILRIYDAGTFEELHYIVMDYVTGGTLAQYAQKGPLPVEEVRQIGIQIADALNYAHTRPRPIVHRDLKPSNILLDDGRPLITDFGIAYIVSTEQRLTQTGSSLGTPEYMSPEQSEGLPVDGRTDIYSLGVILYQLATGRVPFQAATPLAIMHQVVYSAPPPPSQFKSDIPKWLETIILRAISKRPADRFVTAKEMADALREQRVVPVSTEGVGEPAGATQVVTRKPRARATAVGAGAAAAAGSERRGGKGVIIAVLTVAVLALLGGVAFLALPGLHGAGGSQQVVQASAPPTSEPSVQPTVPAPSPTSPAAAVAAVPTTAQQVKLAPTLTASDTAAPSATLAPSATPQPQDTAKPAGAPPTATPPPPTATPVPPTASPVQATATATQPAAPAALAGPAKPGTVLDFENFGTWQVGNQKYGTLTQSTEQTYTGKASAKFAYDFPAVDNEFLVFSDRPAAPIAGKPAALNMWVYGDGSGHFLNVWVKDSAGQVRQFPFGRVTHTGWQQMTASLDTSAPWPQTHIDGPDSTQLAYPLSLQALVLDAVPHGKASKGTIYLDDLTTSDTAASAQAPGAPAAQVANATPTPQASGSTPAALTGHVVFPAARNGCMDIMSLDLASGAMQPVTTNGRQPDVNGGGRIVYNGIGGGKDNLSAVNLDGGGQTAMSNHPEDAYPSWSPDGQTAVFYSTFTAGENRLFTLPANARNQEPTRLTYNGQGLLGQFPTWLSNSRIAFNGCGYQWGSGGLCGIWSVNADGSDPQRVTDNAGDHPTASRGGRMLFNRQAGGNSDVYVTSDTGGPAANLTNNPSQDFGASFSPDGRYVAFMSDRDGWGIWVMNADGSGQHKVASVPGGFGGSWAEERLSWGV